jgi:molecular chaperone HscB
MAAKISSLLLSRAKSTRLYSQASVICWKCRMKISLSVDVVEFICPCEHHVILPPTTYNYFKIMSCGESFDVDITLLKKRYHQLQVLLHPDKYTLKTAEEQKHAADNSSLVNKSYNTLQNPYSRGLYLLGLHGLTINETDNTAMSHGGGMEFLEKIMTINEEIRDDPSLERLQALHQDNERLLDACMTSTSECFTKGQWCHVIVM